VSVSPREKSAENAAVVSANYTKHCKEELNVPFDISVWKECRKSQKGRVFTNVIWRYEVIQGLKTVNTVCSFAFKRHAASLRDDNTLRGVNFRCEGYCTFSTCNVTFVCQIDANLQLHAWFQGDVCHSLGGKASRYVQGPAGNDLKKLLKHKNPRLHHLKMLQNVDQDARESGCRDSCQSKGGLKQICYESRKIATPPSNVWLALQSTKENQNQMSASSATLQSISLDSPAVIFYSKKTIRILHNVWKDDIIFT